jgi:peptide/nickel transport system ATP-binding protein
LLACVPDAEGKKPLKPIDYAWLKNEQVPVWVSLF